ncbi:MAG: FG-GAP repeat domain-containing protein [Thermoanaerobaculia bacterium]
MTRSRIVRAAGFLALVFTLALTSAVASAQDTREKKPHWGSLDANKPERTTFAWAGETPEQRRERLGTQEDPGPDPDPTVKWIRFGREFTIEKFAKKFAAFDAREGWVRPRADVNMAFEIYQEDAESVWIWAPVRQQREPKRLPTDPQRAFKDPEREKEYQTWVAHARPEFDELPLATSDVTLTFEESSKGLPSKGSWRNALDVADINEDGHPDIIAPPERGAIVSRASVFLGDGKGNWRYWEESNIPNIAAYGSVVTADLNRDGNLDLVYGAHLNGVVVQLGDGKGNFVDSSKGLPVDFPTRRAIVADVDGDKDLDIVALTEGPKPSEGDTKVRLRAYLNDGKAKSWKEVFVSELHREVGGDYLAAANFNGDKFPDFVGSSIYINGPDLFYVSEGPAKWAAKGRGVVPFFSIYGPVTTGKFSGKKTDEAILSFVRYWPASLVDVAINPHPRIQEMVGLERVWFDGKEMKRESIARWAGMKYPWGLASGDFNSDGKRDLVYTTAIPREFVILLGDGKGHFKRAKLEGLVPRAQMNYDLKVADVNRDKIDDILVMYESDEGASNGSVQVYLGRGTGAKGAGK